VKLLDNLYTSPSQLLAKARRDRDALVAAEAAGDEVGIRDKLFDFSVSIHSMLDWIKSLYPAHEAAAFALLNSTPALRACRDIANSNKHYELTLGVGPYRRFAPVVDDVDYSLGPSVSYSVSVGASLDGTSVSSPASPGPTQRLKVIYVTGNRARATDVADEALAAWETFLSNHGISSAP
jgi:hypothetical protein